MSTMTATVHLEPTPEFDPDERVFLTCRGARALGVPVNAFADGDDVATWVDGHWVGAWK